MDSDKGEVKINKRASNAARALQKLGAKKAGINRWAGKSEEEKKAHSRLMSEARWGKRVPTNE